MANNEASETNEEKEANFGKSKDKKGERERCVCVCGNRCFDLGKKANVEMFKGLRALLGQ